MCGRAAFSLYIYNEYVDRVGTKKGVSTRIVDTPVGEFEIMY